MNERNERESHGTGHPLPHSAEAKMNEVPEHLIREKGFGDDAAEPVQPEGDPVAPDGEAYALRLDEQTHQDRDQSWVEKEERGEE